MRRCECSSLILDFTELICFGPRSKPVFTEDFIGQLVMHVHIYAELLFRWQMYEKRIQLLKTVNKRNHVKEENKGVQHQIGESRPCLSHPPGSDSQAFKGSYKHVPTVDNPSVTRVLSVMRVMSRELWLSAQFVDSPSKVCSFLRMSYLQSKPFIAGLSRNCLHCYHVSHISCWNALEVPICPTGCGCLCNGFPFSSQESNLTRPSTRLAFSPPAPTALILS